MSRASKVLGRVLEDDQQLDPGADHAEPKADTTQPEDPGYDGMTKSKLDDHAKWMRDLEKAADKTLSLLRELSKKAEERPTMRGADTLNPFARAEQALMTEIRSWSDQAKHVEHLAMAKGEK